MWYLKCPASWVRLLPEDDALELEELEEGLLRFENVLERRLCLRP
jgi:hypothetical protein